MNDIELIKAEIERMHQLAVLAACGNHTDWLRSRIATCVDILAFIDSLPEEQDKTNELPDTMETDCIRLKRGVCRLDMKPCRESCPLKKTREEMEQQRKSNV